MKFRCDTVPLSPISVATPGSQMSSAEWQAINPALMVKHFPLISVNYCRAFGILGAVAEQVDRLC